MASDKLLPPYLVSNGGKSTQKRELKSPLNRD